MSFDPTISEWGNPPMILGKSKLFGSRAVPTAFGGLALRRRAPSGATAGRPCEGVAFGSADGNCFGFQVSLLGILF
jgi:hypothetical protein